MRNADSKNELRLRIKLESKREKEVAEEASASLTLMDGEKEENQLY
jgi:twitching motility protein PilU